MLFAFGLSAAGLLIRIPPDTIEGPVPGVAFLHDVGEHTEPVRSFVLGAEADAADVVGSERAFAPADGPGRAP